MEHLEIERKFLVTSNAYRDRAVPRIHIAQGFLNTDPERTVQVGTKGKEASLTIKGRNDRSGTTRFEWETPTSKYARSRPLNGSLRKFCGRKNPF